MDPRSTRAIAGRLLVLRMTLAKRQPAYKSQTEFCRAVDIARNSWNNYEKGYQRISVDSIQQLKRRFPWVTADWILWGERQYIDWQRLQELDETEKELFPEPQRNGDLVS